VSSTRLNHFVSSAACHLVRHGCVVRLIVKLSPGAVNVNQGHISALAVSRLWSKNILGAYSYFLNDR
jgi:hypothetical protein